MQNGPIFSLARAVRSSIFRQKTLLLAFGGTTHGVYAISKELLFEHNIYSLTVDITLDMTAVAQGWHIVLITDKINTQQVTLNLNKHFENPYMDIVGCWKLQNAVYGHDNKERTSIEFNDSPVLYVFTNQNKLTLTGSESVLPEDLSIPDGEHGYEYHKPQVGILALPAPNFKIDHGEPLFCLAPMNDNTLTLGGEKPDRQSGKTFRWHKTFIKQD
jgi:hypothetical protein